jgi:hypothetical protein
MVRVGQKVVAMASGEMFRVDLEALASSAAQVSGQDLNDDGIDFAAMERDNVEKSRAVGGDGPPGTTQV